METCHQDQPRCQRRSRGHHRGVPDHGLPGRPHHAARPPGIGSSFDAQDASGDTYRVTLVKVIDPARPVSAFGTPPDPGYPYVAAVFTVRALKGVPRGENAAAAAEVTCGDGYQYTSVREPVVGYANLGFAFGAIHVAEGAAVTGGVLFEIPEGATVTGVEWTGAALRGTVRWRVRS